MIAGSIVSSRSTLHVHRAIAVLAFALLAAPVCAQDAKAIYAEVRDSIFQILIIEKESTKKAAIGSGFLIDQSGLIATNFHVISQAVHEPEKYRVEFLDSAGEQGPLSVVGFDVVHDLALARLESPIEAPPLALSSTEVTKGEPVYSVGNPYDLGQTIVPGTFNGLLERSFYQRLLFSGSLNPGMSGGPALNEAGDVIGVNVATSGNQISFLVPVKYLVALAGARKAPLDPEQFQAEIGRQLVDDQEYKYRLLLDREWTTQTLGETLVAADLNDYFKCWGNTNDDEDLKYRVTQTSCTSEDNIFISSRFHTGAIDYQYAWVTSKELNTMQFHSLFSNLYSSMYTRNRANEDDVTNYQCEQDFVGDGDAGAPEQWRSVFCVRQYKRYPALYDILYMGSLFGKPDKALSSHFALSGVTKDNAMAFTKKFLELQSWGS
jgi:hypothetical protein